MSSPMLLKPEQAARELGISRSKLFDLLAIGEIESLKIGRSRRISRMALVEFVRQRLNNQEIRLPEISKGS